MRSQHAANTLPETQNQATPPFAPTKSAGEDTGLPAHFDIAAVKPRRAGRLRGYVTAVWRGLELPDCPVFVGSSGAYVTLPSRPVLDADGRQKREPATSRPQYAPAAIWRDRRVAAEFSAAVITILRRRYPEFLDSA